MVRGILEKAGHRVYVVENGEQALDVLETHRFDVALFDLRMPVMDGLEALKVYRFTHAEEDAIPVMMLSADATPEARRECSEAGAAAFIAKPIHARTLLEALSNVLQHRQALSGDDLEPATPPTQSSDRHERPQPSAKIIDRDTLRDLEQLGGNLAFVAELVDGFTKDAMKLFAQMDEAIAMHVPEQFRDLTHALKGSAGSVGARRLHDLCGRACRINDRDFADIAVSEIQAMFHDTRSALEGYLRERKNQVSQS